MLNRRFSKVSIESSHDFKASLCGSKLTNLTLKGLNGSLKVSTMVVFYPREKEEKKKREEKKKKSEEREGKLSTLGDKGGPHNLVSFLTFD